MLSSSYEHAERVIGADEVSIAVAAFAVTFSAGAVLTAPGGTA